MSKLGLQYFCLTAMLGFSMMLTGCASVPEPSTKGQQGVAEVTPSSKGQELFLTHCASCHQGGGTPPGPNAVILNSSTLASETSFNQLLRKPNSPMMRAFSPDELNDSDVHELYLYISGLNQKYTELL